MDDFRSQLRSVVDEMRARGIEPAFLVVDLVGAAYIKRAHGIESLEKFRETAIEAVASAAGGCETFTYGEERVVAILGGWHRLRTFALIQRLRRALPLLAQSFDCLLQPEFDIIEYDEQQEIAGLVNQLAKMSRQHDVA